MTQLTHLERLEAESIHIMREVVAECERPVMLYSIGKDSAVMLHLALKAFHPAKLPFPLLHVDTTWKFREMIRFRDALAKRLGLGVLVHEYLHADLARHAFAQFVHGAELPRRVHVQQRERQLRGVEGLERQVQHHRAVLADRVEHHRLLALGHDLAHDLDALGLQPFEVGERARVQHGVGLVVHAIFTTVRPVTRPFR
jgi:3'-phosphoadenosine 5'-phosphosulfate sulfotransferase (PAPS reductase)/FAD synthetase